MSPNRELLTNTMQYIHDHPHEHNQAVYGRKAPCGTAHCFAGHAVVLAGYTIKWNESGYAYQVSDGRWIEDVAMRALGIGPDDAGELFRYNNTVDDLQQVVNEILTNTTTGDTK